MKTKDKGYAPPRWEFDGKVTGVFENMLQRSIPQYEVMRRAVTDLAAPYAQPRTDVVDIGCSRGEALASMIARVDTILGAQFIGLEVSEPMIAAARERFKSEIDAGVADVRKWNLKNGLPPLRPSVILSILTLQFVPIEYRQRVLSDCFDMLRPGGALLLVEKVIGNTSEIEESMIGLYHKLKAGNGYTTEQIERKKLALEGVLVPLTAHFNEELLRSAGFTRFDCFWRWMNFAGWIALR